MPKIRLGSIEFINSLPVDLGLLSRSVALDAEITQGSPKALNEKLLRGELDLSPVSAFFFAKHSELFYALPDLSISSLSGVESVLLVSRKPIEELRGEPIALTNKGQTTPVLLEIICRLKYNFKPNLIQKESGQDMIQAGAAAALVIGDEALLLKQKTQDKNIFITDLAAEWRAWTGLPIVFALWAVRRDFYALHAEEAQAAHKAIILSREWGIKNLALVSAKAKEKINLSEEQIRNYFSLLSYNLNESLLRGMNLYFQYAQECGFLSGKPSIEMMPEKSFAGKN